MTVKIIRYEPDYSKKCRLCDKTPVVTLVDKSELLYTTDMCGPCTWIESRMIDPDLWNENIK